MKLGLSVSVPSAEPPDPQFLGNIIQSQDITSGFWFTAGCGRTAAGLVTPDAVQGIHRINYPWNPIPGALYRVSGKIKGSGVRYVYVNCGANLLASICVDTLTGALALSGGTGHTCVRDANGWCFFTYFGIGQNTAGNNIYFQANSFLGASDDLTYAGDNVQGFSVADVKIRVW